MLAHINIFDITGRKFSLVNTTTPVQTPGWLADAGASFHAHTDFTGSIRREGDPMDGRKTAQRREDLTPDIETAWRSFSRAVFKEGTLDPCTKQLIAVAVAHVTQCPDCLHNHARAARKAGAEEAQILEAIWVAAEMRAGGAVAHTRRAFEALEE